jgi:hypothetical protein
MLYEIYYILCKIIKLIQNFYFPTNPDRRTVIGIKNILENTYEKLEKKYYNDVLLGYFRR